MFARVVVLTASLVLTGGVPRFRGGDAAPGFRGGDAAPRLRGGDNAPAFRGRVGHAATYDERAGLVLVFGGAGPDGEAPYPRDLWGWDGTAWRQLSSDGPPGRDDALLVYDTRRRVSVLYGGRTFGSNRSMRVFTDTWEWDGHRWTQRDSVGPGPRVHAGMTYDAGAGRVVLFGGFDPARDAPRRDTWSWDGTRWSRIDAPVPDSMRVNALYHDASRGAVAASVVAPGGDLMPAATWELRDRWVVVDSAPAFSPLAPVVAASGLRQIVLFAGFDPPPDTAAKTWIRSGTTWRRGTGESPGRRLGAAAAYDSRRRVVVLVSGDNDHDDAARLTDVWEWDGARWLRVDGGR